MFKLFDGRDAFYQWDLDRKLIVEDDTISQVHFCNKTSDCSLVCDVKDGLVDVPNILLQKDFRITVYGYDVNYTKHCETFDVIKRSKPEGYVYTEEELKVWNELENRIEILESKEVDIDLSDYATREYVDNSVDSLNITNDVKEAIYQLLKNAVYNNDSMAVNVDVLKMAWGIIEDTNLFTDIRDGGISWDNSTNAVVVAPNTFGVRKTLKETLIYIKPNTQYRIRKTIDDLRIGYFLFTAKSDAYPSGSENFDLDIIGGTRVLDSGWQTNDIINFTTPDADYILLGINFSKKYNGWGVITDSEAEAIANDIVIEEVV